MLEFVEDNWPTLANNATAYENISTVEPGAVMELRVADMRLHSTPLETIEQTLSRLPKNVDIETTLSSSVGLRLRSDVPTAILLSGGVDSSIVAGFAKLLEEHEGQIKWYTGETKFGKDPGYARDVANSLGVDLVTIDVADEIFGGYYNRYAQNVVNDFIRSFRWKSARDFIRDCQIWEHYDHQKLDRHVRRSLLSMLRFGRCTDPALISLFKAQFNDVVRGVLPRWLYMNDQNSMAHSIEARSPLLDYRLLPALRGSVNEKFYRGYNKYALRNAIPSNISEAVRWRRDKQGFRYNSAHAIRDQRLRFVELINSSDYVREHFHSDVQNLSTIHPARLLSLSSIAMLEQANKSRRINSLRDAA